MESWAEKCKEAGVGQTSLEVFMAVSGETYKAEVNPQPAACVCARSLLLELKRAASLSSLWTLLWCNCFRLLLLGNSLLNIC